MSKFLKPYTTGPDGEPTGYGNVLAWCMCCGRATHSSVAQRYAVFQGTDSVYCLACVDEAAHEEEEYLREMNAL